MRGSHLPHECGLDHLQSRLQVSCLPCTNGKHYQTPVCESPPPPRTPRCRLACRSTQVVAASTRQRPRVAAWLAERQASHTWRAATGPSLGKGPPSLPSKGGEDPHNPRRGVGDFPFPSKGGRGRGPPQPPKGCRQTPLPPEVGERASQSTIYVFHSFVFIYHVNQ